MGTHPIFESDFDCLTERMALAGRVCLVTGASRGIGKGIAKALANQDATVYITGRNEETLKKTSDELGVNIVPVVCDHSNDSEVEKLFKQIESDNDGRLDFLVNNCYAAVTTLLGKENNKPVNKFWEQDPLIWDKVNRVGLRANYIASVYAARLMVPRGSGLIANISSAGGLTYLFNTAYGVGKAAQDRMAQDFNVELKGTGVYALAVWPGAVKTELIQENILDVNEMPEAGAQKPADIVRAKRMFQQGQTTDWVGRTVAALLDDPNIKHKAGRVIWCMDIADEFNIVENDGSVVPSHRSIRGLLQMVGKPGLASYFPAWMVIPSTVYKWLLWAKGNKF